VKKFVKTTVYKTSNRKISTMTSHQYIYYTHCLFQSNSHAPLFQDVEPSNTVSEIMEPHPPKQVCKPTWKDLETAPIDTSSSSSDSDDRQASPVEGDDSCAPTAEGVSHFIAGSANQFGVVQEYQQLQTAVPITENQSSTISSSLTADRDIADIIYPYPNVSAFLFNLTWRWMQGVSSSGCASITKVLLDKHFKKEDMAGIDFTAIEKELAADTQSPWGSNGW
jgi:hypothetical protein